MILNYIFQTPRLVNQGSTLVYLSHHDQRWLPRAKADYYVLKYNCFKKLVQYIKGLKNNFKM